MIEAKLHTITSQNNRSFLEENWPPKWFFSYADLATLLMTFFIVLATMLSLKIPLYVLADKKIQILMKERISELEEVRRLTEKEKKILKDMEKLEPTDIENILEIERIREFSNKIKTYITEKNLKDFLTVEESRWYIRVIPLAGFLFNPGSSVLREEAKIFLDRIADFLKTHPSLVRIEGHTDNIPIRNRRFSSNWELSIARANSVMRYLAEKHHLPIERIEAIGYGEFRPFLPNDNEENRAKNRRVILEIVPLLTY